MVGGKFPDMALSEHRGDWFFPTTVRFGAGRLEELAAEMQRMAMVKPLVVTDSGLSAIGLAQKVIDAAGQRGAIVNLFDQVSENPTDIDVYAGVERFRELDCDGVIAVGGGSGLDCGKAIALISGVGGTLDRFLWPETRSEQERSPFPIIAIPTTAGTGAEVEASSMITMTERQVKGAVVQSSLLPKLVIADPVLTLSLPRHLTAWTGMDALSHNLEALCVPDYHPMADSIATEGAQLCMKWLAAAVDDGSNLAARSSMMVAAMMGATAFVKGLGAMHALSHAIGGLHATQHGLTNAILMPHVLRFNRPLIEEKISDLASRCDLAHGFDGFLTAVEALQDRIGIHQRLSDIGVPKTSFDAIVSRAQVDGCAGTNPRPLDRDNLLTLLQAAH
jgi:alcohol dehydrogenase class IV